jgi:hypothetical protein
LEKQNKRRLQRCVWALEGICAAVTIETLIIHDLLKKGASGKALVALQKAPVHILSAASMAAYGVPLYLFCPLCGLRERLREKASERLARWGL